MFCTAHPTVEATWRCTQCPEFWCAACPRNVGLTAHVVCAACGAEVVTYAPERSLEDMTVRAVRRAVSREGLLTALAFGAFYGVLGWLFVVPFIVLGSLVTYYFVIIHHVGGGGDGLPTAGEAADNWGQLRGAAIGGILCALLGFAPLIAVFATASEPLPPRLIGSLIFVGQLYMPAVVIAIAVSGSPSAALWPPVWFRVIARAPSAYVRFAGLWVITVVIGLALAWVPLYVHSQVGDSMIVDGVSAFVWSVFWFWQAALVGEYIRGHREAFGWD